DTTSTRPQHAGVYGGSAAGAPRLVAKLAQFRHQAVAVLALNFDDAVPHRTAGAAQLLEARREFLELRHAERQAADHRHGPATAPGGLPANAHAGRAGRGCGRRRAAAWRVPQYDAAKGGAGFHVVLPV